MSIPALAVTGSGKSTRGFSMVELLMVAFIMGVGLLGLAALMTLSIQSSTAGRQRETAAILANNVQERLVADGRRTALMRVAGVAIPATGYLLANATADAVNTYSDVDSGSVSQTSFDLDGRPSSTSPIFQVNWVRRVNKSGNPAAAALTSGAEVVVNVSWSEAAKTSAGATQLLDRSISVSRYTNY